MPTAEQAPRDGATEVQPGRTWHTVQGIGGSGEGCGSEGFLDPGAYGVEIDPHGRQCVPVEVTEQSGPAAKADLTDDFRFDVCRRDALLAQHSAGGPPGGSHGEQEMFAADVTVPEAAGMFLSVDHNRPGVRSETLEHHRPRLAPRLAERACGARSAW